MISVIVPTHNEEKRIGGTMEKLQNYLDSAGIDYEVMVADDGTDRTAEIVSKFGARNKGIKLIHFNRRLGKWGAILEAVKQARGDALIYDADASVPPAEIGKVVVALKEFDVVVGSRNLEGARVESGFLRRVYGRLFNLLVRVLFGLKIGDTQCGFKAARKKVWEKIGSRILTTGFAGDVEFLVKAKKFGFSVKEIPVKWRHVGGGPFQKSTLKNALKMFREVIELKLRG
jgi:glycosyltransferase involved in cell wall biosynthesis